MSDKKHKAIETVEQQIIKEYGAGSIMRLGGDTKLEVDTISTGSLSLDMALGIGGVPRGRVIEIFGPEVEAPYPYLLYAGRIPCLPTIYSRSCRFQTLSWCASDFFTDFFSCYELAYVFV